MPYTRTDVYPALLSKGFTEMRRVWKSGEYPVLLVGNGGGNRAEGDVIDAKVIAAAVSWRNMPRHKLPGHHRLGVRVLRCTEEGRVVIWAVDWVRTRLHTTMAASQKSMAAKIIA